MPELSAFIGHSFLPRDADVVRCFLDFFNTVASLGIGFSWDHAEEAEAKELPSKVLAKMEGRNLLIAICTLKEVTIAQDRLNKLPFLTSMRVANANYFDLKTSDWIIQEIGCAVGRGMDIIILLEEGLRVPGGLQGNKEYISFNRKNPQAIFPKILQMLRSLTSEPSSGRIAATSPAVLTKDSPVSHPPTSLHPDSPQEDWTIQDFENALLSSIVDDDIAAEEALTRSHAERFGKVNKVELARWEAFKLLYKMMIKQADVLPQILKLAQQNTDNPDIISILGRAYEVYGQDEPAARHFHQSARLTDDSTKRISRLCLAAEAFARVGDSSSARQVIAELSTIPQPNITELALIEGYIADISKVLLDNDSYEAFSEACLELIPDDHDKRFSLAYHYSENSQSDLAFYHYDILAKRSPNEMVWNNLGVAASQLQLPATSVHAYRQSEQLGCTLAMSNIANILTDAGFLDEAESTAKKALEKQNYDKRVAISIGRTKSVAEAEEIKLQETLNKIKPRRFFYRDYATAILQPQLKPFSSSWRSPDCELAVDFDGRFLIAKGSFAKKKGPVFSIPSLTAPSQKSSEAASILIHYIAEFRGQGGAFRQWSTEGRAPNPDIDKPSATGLMIVNEDQTRIRVYQHGTRVTEVFYDLQQISDKNLKPAA